MAGFDCSLVACMAVGRLEGLDESLVVCMAACLVWMAVLLAWIAFWCGTSQSGGRGLLFRRIGRQVGGFDARMSGHLVWLAVWWTWVAVWCVI